MAEMSQDRPSIFIGYPNLRYERSIVRRLRKDLEKRGIDLYLLIEDSRIGEKWTEAAERKIEESDGVMIVWTGRSKGTSVEHEVDYALSRKKPLALILEHGEPPPPQYPKEVVYAELRGLPSFPNAGRWRGISIGPSEPDYSSFLNQLTVFSWRSATKRAIASELKRHGFDPEIEAVKAALEFR